MADIHVRTCFAFRCTETEWHLLQQAFLLALDLSAKIAPDEPDADFMTLFPPDNGDRWAGFRLLFDDPDFPEFGADLAGGQGTSIGEWQAILSAETNLDPMAIGRLIQTCCSASLAQGPIGFEWAETCSRQRIGEFGGGWCAVFADRIEIETTRQVLAEALSGGII